VIKNSVSQIIEVKKSSSNLVNEYFVTVGTNSQEKAVLVVDKNSANQVNLVDLFKYV